MNRTAGTSNEWAFILWCARRGRDESSSQLIRELAQEGVNWEELLALACRHGMIPLLHRRLEALRLDGVPVEFSARLADLSRAIARRNVVLATELTRALELFEEHGIAAIPFKGPLLAALAYGDLALRPFDDLDILVREKDVLRAQALLVGCGFQPIFAPPRTAKAVAVRSDHAFRHEGSALVIDLHWRIAQTELASACRAMEDCWERLQPVALSGETIRTLSLPDLYLTLGIHGAKHGWERLVWICDIAGLLQRADAGDCRAAIEQAKRRSCNRMMSLAFFLAHDLLDALPPGETLNQLTADPAVPSLAERVRRGLLDPADVADNPARRDRIYRGAMERRRDRIRYRFRQLLTPTPHEWGMVALPDLLFALYYVLRPVRLVVKYIFSCSQSLYHRFRRSQSQPGQPCPKSIPHVR